MKKLNRKAREETVGAAGITGALFSGIAALFNPIAGIIATVIGSIVNAIHSFTDKHVKAEYKFGSSSMEFDDGKEIDFKTEELKHNVKNEIKVEPVVQEQTFLGHNNNQNLTQGLDDQDEYLNNELDLNHEQQDFHEFY